MKNFLALITLFASLIACSQVNDSSSTFNFGFEAVENNTPNDWYTFGSEEYILALDSLQPRSGNYAATISLIEGISNFGAWAYDLPHNYAGNEITLSGYIKTAEVTDGYAGLWMRIDTGIAFDNMNDRGVVGSTEWIKYEVTLKMNPDKTEKIVIGGLLVGKGKMWMDDLKVTIDGKEIHELELYERELLPAEKDTEFDAGSGITSISLDKNKHDNLIALGKVWGFIKYYHPAIARGDHNWDYELFRVMPKILESKTKEKRDAILISWIESLGTFSKESEPKVNIGDVKMYPDLEWITQSKFSTELTTLLNKVKNAKRTEDHFYLGFNPNARNPDFKNEKAYTSMTYPDAGFRMLALYRYWNIIQYYFPYKCLIDENWHDVLDTFIPPFINAADETEYTLAVLELIERVHDTHANIWGGNKVLNAYFGELYAPVQLTFVEEKPVVTRFYDEALGKETGLEIGDVITKISGVSVEEIIKNSSKHTPASNYPTKLRNIARKLLRSNDSSIQIEFIRDGKKHQNQLNTFPVGDLNFFPETKESSFKMINSDIAYIDNGMLKRDELPAMWEEIKNSKGLIIDIRNYPTDFVIYELSKYLLPQNAPFVKFTNGSLESPGIFTFTEPLEAGMENPDHYKGKVVILINETTQSSAEFHTMAYSLHPRATVLGSTTAAADGNVSRFSLPGGITTMITGIGVYYPDGTETQRIGIVPDIELKPTIQGVKEGRDELMEKAMEIINEEG